MKMKNTKRRRRGSTREEEGEKREERAAYLASIRRGPPLVPVAFGTSPILVLITRVLQRYLQHNLDVMCRSSH